MPSRSFKRLQRNGGAWVGLLLVLLVIGCALLGPWLAPFDPTSQFPDDLLDANGLPITHHVGAHWLGGDVLARDALSRLLAGARVSILVALAATALALVIGVSIGLLAGYVGRRTDSWLMRLVDLVLSMPFLLIAIVMQRVWDTPSIFSISIILGAFSWTTLARITRAKTQQVRSRDYIEAGRATGISHMRLVLRHVLPNILGPIIAITTIMVAGMILAESALSFLGLGIRPPAASWGSMLNEAVPLIYSRPWLMVYPALCICTAVFGFNLLGEGMRDALDPKE